MQITTLALFNVDSVLSVAVIARCAPSAVWLRNTAVET